MKTKILVADVLSNEGIELLKSIPEFELDVFIGLSPKNLLEIISVYDALLIRSSTKATKELIQKAIKLKMIGRAGIGIDNIDIYAAKTANIVVMNTPHGNNITTAEHAICLLMSLARHIPQASASIKSGSWEKTKFNGVEIHEKILGILGLGNIGSIVATLAKGLRMRVIAYDPLATEEKARTFGAKLVSLDELYQNSDFISIHVPLIRETYHLIGEGAFRKMKKGVFIINAARGGIINEDALLDALNRGDVQGAALDVFETEPPDFKSEFLKHPRLIATPHLGASTKEAQNRVALQIAEQTRDFFLKNQIRHQVC